MDVISIPAAAAEVEKIKVAAYARVSTDSLNLIHSLENQISYYEGFIKSNPAWEFAGIYADEGITGTSTKHRDGFKKMIADCEAGKIDMILTKSISRFARDTVDCLKTTRHLKELGIPVCFEREKTNTMTAEGELMITLLASFAQEEARSISKNVKWAIRKRFEEGIPNGHKVPYGYRWDGEIYRLLPECGKVVQEIYERYLAGESVHKIAKSLSQKGITGQAGKPIEQSAVKEILKNPAYTGKLILQKYYYTEGKVRKINKGELPMYMVDGMYDPVITEADFDAAQDIRKKRALKYSNNWNSLTVFSGKVKCGNCGKSFSRRGVKGYKKWVCNEKERKGKEVCDSRLIKETDLIAAAGQVLGKDYETLFNRKIRQITVYGDRLDFVFHNGRIKSVDRKYDLGRGENPFTCKVHCSCGSVCRRSNAAKGSDAKIWWCTSCHHKISQDELIRASKDVLGVKYAGLIVERVGDIILSDKKISFKMKGGETVEWERM